MKTTVFDIKRPAAIALHQLRHENAMRWLRELGYQDLEEVVEERLKSYRKTLES